MNFLYLLGKTMIVIGMLCATIAAFFATHDEIDDFLGGDDE